MPQCHSRVIINGMFSNFSRAWLFCALVIFLFPLVSLSANPFLDNITWAAHGSVFYFAADNGQGADPAPIIVSAGASAAYRLLNFLKIEMTEDIYFHNYEYNWQLKYAMPCNPENRSAFVMGFLTGFQLTGSFPITKSGIGLRVFGGPAIDIRIVVKAFGLNHPDDYLGDENDVMRQTKAIREYMWGSGRFFYPVAGFGMDFPVNEKLFLGFDIRAWFPLYRMWTDNDLPKKDGWRFGVGLRVTPRRSPSVQKITPQIEQPVPVEPAVQQNASPVEVKQTQPRTETQAAAGTETEMGSEAEEETPPAPET